MLLPPELLSFVLSPRVENSSFYLFLVVVFLLCWISLFFLLGCPLFTGLAWLVFWKASFSSSGTCGLDALFWEKTTVSAEEDQLLLDLLLLKFLLESLNTWVGFSDWWSWVGVPVIDVAAARVSGVNFSCLNLLLPQVLSEMMMFPLDGCFSGIAEFGWLIGEKCKTTPHINVTLFH